MTEYVMMNIDFMYSPFIFYWVIIWDANLIASSLYQNTLRK